MFQFIDVKTLRSTETSSYTLVYIFLKNPYLLSPILCIVFEILKLLQNFSPKLGYFQKIEENMPKMRDKYKNQR